MAYQRFNVSNEDSSNAIYLYTTPLRNQSRLLKLKKPRAMVAHWAVCIQGRCYELTRNTTRTKNEAKYNIKFTDEQEWTRAKEEENRVCERARAGTMFMPYPRETIERLGESSSPGLRFFFPV